MVVTKKLKCNDCIDVLTSLWDTACMLPQEYNGIYHKKYLIPIFVDHVCIFCF